MRNRYIFSHKTHMLLFLCALQSFYLSSKENKPTIIALYGCSSVGKTSISNELHKILPGNWKYIAGNQFQRSGNHSRNYYLWQEINRTIANGYNVMVDTHNQDFLVDPSKDVNLLVVMLHCSPDKLIEHICQRNTNQDRQTHRNIRAVFKEFCGKYKSVKKDDAHIDALDRDSLQNNYGFITTLALKKIINTYFVDKNQQVAYIAPHLKSYDCFVDTGKLSISACAQKIKKAFMAKAVNK